MARQQNSARPCVSVLERGRTLNFASEHAQLAVIAVSTRDRRTACVREVADLANRVDRDALARYVIQQRISLVVPPRLEELGLSRIARILQRQVGPIREQASASAKVHWLLTDGLLRRLEDLDIPALTLKGVDLSERLYGDSASRESRDIDVLVLPEHLEQAVLVAQQEFGYAPPVDAVDEGGRPLLHYRLEHPNGWPALEIHWRVHWYESASGPAILRRSSMQDGRRAMAPTHELASLLLFYARDGFVGIREVAAIAAWWDRYGEWLPASGLADFAREFPELSPALATSATVASQLVGLPIEPLHVCAGPATLRERRAAHLADPQPGLDASRLLADMALVDLLLAPRLDLKGFIRRQMLMDDSYNQALKLAAGDRRRKRRPIPDRILWRAAKMASGLATARPTGLEIRD